MERFSHTFLQYIQKEDILILALSGGVDSMALIDITLQLHPLSNIIVAHFDHSLRGEESDGDSEFIADFCHSRNIGFEVEKMDIADLAKTQKMSIEAGARKYRYEFLFRMREKYEAKYILTAHHLDDRIETAVFNLLRGTKLRGIHALSDISLQGIFRPLITCTKKEILRYARENNIIYREDSSNASNDYLRNQLRHDIIPKFEQINPDFRFALSNFIHYTEELKEWIDGEVEGFL